MKKYRTGKRREIKNTNKSNLKTGYNLNSLYQHEEIKNGGSILFKQKTNHNLTKLIQLTLFL